MTEPPRAWRGGRSRATGVLAASCLGTVFSVGLTVVLLGREEPFRGRIRFISAEATFTPYFALTEHDRSRLSYLAEIDLVEETASELPTGIPVEVRVGE